MSLRERVSGRALPTKHFYLRIDDDAALREQLANANDKERARLQKRIDGCYECLTVRTISPRRWQQLVEEHPPPDGDDEAQWGETFVPALLAESVEGDISAADWTTYLETGVLTSGEVSELASLAIELNHRVYNPKG